MSRLLVVDQDARALLVMEMSLRNAGIEVTGAENAEEALAHLEAEEYDLILSEVDLPALNGFEFLEKVKTDTRLSNIPFIFVTRRQHVEDKIQGLEMGADDYITRPIYLREFVTRIRSFLRKRELEAVGTADLRQKYRGKITSNVIHDIILSTEEGERSARLVLERQGRSGAIFIKEGRIIDAECGRLTGTQALYRLLLWNDGAFMIHFTECDRKPRIKLQNEELFFQAMSRSKVWRQLQKLVKGLSHVSLLDVLERSDRLRDPPEALRLVVRTMMTGNLPSPSKVEEDLPQEFVSNLKFLARNWENSDERFLIRIEEAEQDDDKLPDGTISGTWSMDENTELAQYWRDLLLRDREDEGQSIADRVTKPSNQPSGSNTVQESITRRSATETSSTGSNTDQFPVLQETPAFPIRAVSPHPMKPAPKANDLIPKDEDIGNTAAPRQETTRSGASPLTHISREDTSQAYLEPIERTPAPSLANAAPRASSPATFPALWVDRDIEEPEALPTEPAPSTESAQEIPIRPNVYPAHRAESSQSIPVQPQVPIGQKGSTTEAQTPELTPSPSLTMPDHSDNDSPSQSESPDETLTTPKQHMGTDQHPILSSATKKEPSPSNKDTAQNAVGKAVSPAKNDSTKQETLDVMNAQLGSLATNQDPYDFSDLDADMEHGPLPWKMIALSALMLVICVGVGVVWWYLDHRADSEATQAPLAAIETPKKDVKDPLGLAKASAEVVLDDSAKEGLQALANPEEDRTGDNPLVEGTSEETEEQNEQALTAEEEEPSEPPAALAQAPAEENTEAEEARQRSRERAREARQRNRRSRSRDQNRAQPASTQPAQSNQDTGNTSDAASYNSLIRKGGKLISAGKFAQAAAIFEQAVALIPNRSVGHRNLGKAYYNQGNFQKALSAYKRATQLSPRHAASWLSLGELYQLTGQTAKAKNAYQTYLRLAPNGRSANDVRALLQGM